MPTNLDPVVIDEQPININPTPQEDDTPINIDPGEDTTQLTPETADQRSFKIHYGSGKLLNKDRETVFQDLNAGKEGELRDTASAIVNDRRRQESTKAIADFASKKLGDMTQQDTNSLTGLIDFMNKDVDPGSVFEEGLGKTLMSEMDNYAIANPSSDFAKAKRENPLEVAKVQEHFSDFAAKRAILGTLLENINDEVKQQSLVGYGYDWAKSMIPGYTDIQQRGNVAGVGMLAGGTLGSNIDEQSRALFDLPLDQFKIEALKATSSLRQHNPQMASEFVQGLLSQSTKEAAVRNVSIALDLAGTGVGAAAGKAVKGVIRTPALIKDAAKAAADIAEAGTRPNISKSVIAEGAGDLKEAAVAKATTNLTAELKGVPRATEEAVEALSSAYRIDIAEFEAGAAKAGTSRELVNRFKENSDTLLRNVIKAAVSFNKVDRIPDVLSNEEAVRALLDDIKDLYPTLKNSVLDTTAPYKEKVSTNLLTDIHLGKNDGTYFSNRTTAENFIKLHRLNDAAVEAGADVSRKPTVYYLPESSVKTVSGKANPDFGYEIKDGKARFFSDIGNRVEIQPHNEPAEGLVPVEVSGQNATFGKPLATVEQQGMGYYVRLTVPVPENSQVMRDAIAETGHTKIPDSPAKTLLTNILGKYRSPEEVLSPAERQNRLAVTFGPAAIFDILKDNVKEIQKLHAGRFSTKTAKQRWADWERMLEYADTKIDPASSKPGYSYKSPVDMTTDWIQVLGHAPDEQQIAAYFEFKRGMEVDRMFRNITAHRNQQRVGAMTNRLVGLDEAGKEVKSIEFSGVAKREFPGGDGNILIMDTKLGSQRVEQISRMNSAEKKEFIEKTLKGEGRVIEIFAPHERPLNGFGKITDEYIQYVYAPSIETRSLDWNQIPRRGGGHLQFDYDFYVKQAKVFHDTVGNRFWYEGDQTIIPIMYESMGKDIARLLNQVRIHLAAKNEVAAEAYAQQHLPFEWDEVRGWFMGGKDAEGKYKPPSLNLKEPIQVVGRGETIKGKDKGLERRYSQNKGDGKFKDATKQNNLSRQQQIEFSGERDAFRLQSVEDIGTAGNPLYKAVPAKTVDPITSMQRGLQRIIKSNLYDDYKTSAVEHWLKQAAPYLEASDAKIKYSPFYYYNEAKFKADAPADIVTRLRVAKYHTDQIVGMPSETTNLIHQYAQKMSDHVYQKMGPKAPVLTPSWLIPKLQDPFAFIRSIVFHENLGLFNIPQFIVQAGNYANILGVAGYKYASPGTIAAQLHFWTRANAHPNIINRLDELASKFHMPGTSRWKPGEFKEAFDELNKTGFGVSGREHAILDDPASNKLFTNGVDTFLDWGTAFFRGGEQNARYGAWYTAYREFRDKNPFGRLTDRNRADILQRADLLNVNMSRASSTAMNKGIWSIPTQFYSYQQRLLSLFFSNRITMKERARLLAWNAALYGIPMSAGVTGLPVVDYFRKTATDNGYVVGDNFVTSMLMEGIPSALGAIATGGGDASAGIYYDVNQRFGTKGLEFLGNAGTADKSYLDIAGGAAYSTLKSTIAATDGLRRVLLSMVNLDNDVFPATADDIIDPLKEITSVNSAFRIWGAIAAGQWMSKNEAYLSDTSPTQAIIAALLGVKDQRINDIQTKSNAIKDMTNYQKQAEKSFQQEFRRGMRANKQGDYEAGKTYLARAQRFLELGLFREDQISGVMGRAMDDNRSILDKIDMDYYIKKAPPGRTEDRLDAYKRTQQIKERQ